MIALKGTCRKCKQVYFWTDSQYGLGKSEEEQRLIIYRRTHCKFCGARGLVVETDHETEVGKVYAECDSVALNSIRQITEEIKDSIETKNVGVRMDSGQIDCATCCPKCSRGPLDGATSMDFDDAEAVKHKAKLTPKHGDVTICCFCATLLVFESKGGTTLILREPSRAEYNKLIRNPEIRFAILMTRNLISGE